MASIEGGHVSSSRTTTQPLDRHKSPSKDYQDEDETRDSTLKALWDGEMGTLRSQYIPYSKVSVLLLSWHKDIDDLNTEEEVIALDTLFKERFKFETNRVVLTNDSETLAQNQLNFQLAKFVNEKDGMNTLLIVYYAGHGFSEYGMPGNDREILKLTPSTTMPRENITDPHEVVWDSADALIRKTRADVLVIFDCCHAGELERGVRAYNNHRAFEYLAATSANSTTKAPGPRSFTSALIWSLEHLLEKHTYFSTQELVRTIHIDAPNFPDDQCPRLSEGLRPTMRKIMIAPLTEESKEKAAEANQAVAADNLMKRRTRDLLLRFNFDGDITESMIQVLASQLKQLIQRGDIQAKAVSWEGTDSYITPGVYHLDYKEVMIAQPAIRAFSEILSRNRRQSKISPTGKPRVLVNDEPEAASSSADEMSVATPEPTRTAVVEIGEDQGGSAEKASSPGEGSGSQDTLRLPNLPGGGQAVQGNSLPRKSKRKRGDNDEGAVSGPAAAAKRGRLNRKG
ncbi:hypothetical protein PG985_009955 [Apiospora marii]|uniref:uncharacterized protein n=1 Tax=Apiospora marii TaxID=335849 RepID=UPI00313214CB